jgi:hypothetical protein
VCALADDLNSRTPPASVSSALPFTSGLVYTLRL